MKRPRWLSILKRNRQMSGVETQPSSFKLDCHNADTPRNGEQDYFTQAKSWADDLYTATIASRNRYRTAFYAALGLALCLTFAVAILVPLQHTELVVVHQAEDGVVWVEPTHQARAPQNQAQVQSEIVRYVINRESYSPSSYHEQYELVNLLSDNAIARDYLNEQSVSNKSSPVNALGNQTYRTVHIENVIFLDNVELNKENRDKQTHANLAQVNFSITDHNTVSATQTTLPLTALIAWAYRGTPTDPEAMWRNWDGFTVTRYTVQQRNV